MKILVTGAKGFVGRNFTAVLKARGIGEVYEVDSDTSEALLDKYCGDCGFVFNLAGVNRPKDDDEYMTVNYGFFEKLLGMLKAHENKCPVMNASSGQAVCENAYGRSKRAGEDLLVEYGKQTGAKVYNYRFPGLFGKWGRPNYNSVVATFCYNKCRDLPITISDSEKEIELAYIDDVIEELVLAFTGRPHVGEDGFCFVPVSYKIKLGELADLIEKFRKSRENCEIPLLENGGFEKKLYSTYLSYLPTDKISYRLETHSDERGSFTEILRSKERGQCSFNVTRPGITRGGHWHRSKNEKFLVLSGKARIRFRSLCDNDIIEYIVSSEDMTVVDIPPGYTHDITNIGEENLVTFIWCNECFDENDTDTYIEKVDIIT